MVWLANVHEYETLETVRFTLKEGVDRFYYDLYV